jgi:uridylate kinase
MAKKTNTISNGVEYNTIHIFGYGETQLISSDSNKKVATLTLLKVQAVVDNVYSKKPADNNAGTEYHSINILNNLLVDYIPKERSEKSFRVQYKDLDATLINDLVSELKAIS